MALPEQQYFTLAELAERWSTSERRILELILNTELHAVVLVSAMATASWSDENGNAAETTTTYHLEVRTWFVPDLLFSLFKDGRGDLSWYVEDGKWFTFTQPVTVSTGELLITAAELQRFEQENAVTETPEPKETQAELSNHECMTEEMDILNAAWRKFWKNTSRMDKSTWHDNREVVAWLVESGYSKNVAEAGAKIIKPVWARKGGRR